MTLEMNLQVATGGEAVATDVTFVWSLACVRSQVDLQGTVTPKHLATKPALMLEERRLWPDRASVFSLFILLDA